MQLKQTHPQILSIMESRVNSAKFELNEFVVKLQQDPYFAFEWSNRYMRAAAEKEVYSEIAGICQARIDDKKPDNLAEHICKQMIRCATNHPSSTNMQADELSRMVGIIYAQLFVDFVNL